MVFNNYEQPRKPHSEWIPPPGFPSDWEDEDYEVMDWYSQEQHEGDSYACFININREPMLPGSQAHFCYGKRPNKNLLVNYGFCFRDNKYDSYHINLRANLEDELTVENMVLFDPNECAAPQEHQELRLKTD